MTQNTVSLGSYLASRLRQIGLGHYFAVPGDYNLVLLDQFLAEPGLAYVGCCNELNAGYAADGYARAKGVAAAVVTYSVGSLSIINAIAGASAEDLPVILIAGGPGTTAKAENRHLHHTQGGVDYDYCREIFGRLVTESVVIHSLDDAPSLIDHALTTALARKQPVCIEVPCDLAGLPVPAPQAFDFSREIPADPGALESAVAAAAAILDGAKRPVLVAGPKLRRAGAIEAFRKLAEALNAPVAVMPDAKGFFPEAHPLAIGHYWGPVSSPGCAEVVESADACLFAGALFTDYTTVGYTLPLEHHRILDAKPGLVTLPGSTHTGVDLAAFLEALAGRVRSEEDGPETRRPRKAAPPEVVPGAVLTTRAMMGQVQALLGPETVVVAETGDSWFNGLKLDLPDGAGFEIQMTYGSIGWSVGATLGLAIGHGPGRRVVALIGDGSFQLTAQEVSTMIRQETRPIIFLINNQGYTIEIQIHDGPYNNIQDWDYAGLMAVFSRGGGKGWGKRVGTEGELAEAIAFAKSHDGPCLIECLIDRDDCSEELRTWGTRVAAFNGRRPSSIPEGSAFSSL